MDADPTRPSALLIAAPSAIGWLDEKTRNMAARALGPLPDAAPRVGLDEFDALGVLKDCAEHAHGSRGHPRRRRVVAPPPTLPLLRPLAGPGVALKPGNLCVREAVRTAAPEDDA